MTKISVIVIGALLFFPLAEARQERGSCNFEHEKVGYLNKLKDAEIECRLLVVRVMNNREVICDGLLIRINKLIQEIKKEND